MVIKIVKFESLSAVNDFLRDGSYLTYAKLDVHVSETCYHLVYSFHNTDELDMLETLERNFRNYILNKE